MLTFLEKCSIIKRSEQGQISQQYNATKEQGRIKGRGHYGLLLQQALVEADIGLPTSISSKSTRKVEFSEVEDFFYFYFSKVS